MKKSLTAVDASQDEKTGVLLEDIAESRIRLNKLLLQSKDVHRRLQSSLKQLKETRDNKENFFELLMLRDRSELMARLRTLTAREIEVLRLIVQRFSTKQIADRLQIDFKTAVRHRLHILEKMNCHESGSIVRRGQYQPVMGPVA